MKPETLRSPTDKAAVERLRADLETHDAGGLAYAAAECEDTCVVRAEDLRAVLSLFAGGGER